MPDAEFAHSHGCVMEDQAFNPTDAPAFRPEVAKARETDSMFVAPGGPASNQGKS